MKNIKKEQVWLGCLVIGPILALLAVYYPGLTILAIIFIVIGLKGVLLHVM